jgi:hypothetical protein
MIRPDAAPSRCPRNCVVSQPANRLMRLGKSHRHRGNTYGLSDSLVGLSLIA